MGSYRFKWPHTADKVIVTGTFDGWGQKIELENKGRYHEKVVPISNTKEKILYKYIVNGQWRTDPSHAVERDSQGNENNVLDPDDIKEDTVSSGSDTSTLEKAGAAAAAGAVGAGAASGAAAFAEKDPSPPGAFPDSNEIPLPQGTLQDRVVGVNPIPATSGASNPINLKPGEAVPDPSTYTSNTVNNTVQLSKESYERAGAGGAAYSPTGEQGISTGTSFGRPPAGNGPTTVQVEKGSYDRFGAGGAAYSPSGDRGISTGKSFGRPPANGTFIPESSSFMGSSEDKMNSVGPGATSTLLAGQQPIEPRSAPQVLRKEDDKDGDITTPAIIGGGVLAAGTAGAIASTGPNASTTEMAGQQPIEPRGEPTVLKESEGGLGDAARSSVGPGATTTALAGQQPLESGSTERATTSTVPQEVTESQRQAAESAEASANAEAVKEKSDAEKELLSKVQSTDAKGEPAPTDSAATMTQVPTATSSTGAPQLGDPTGGGLAPISMDDRDGLNATAESPSTPPLPVTQTGGTMISSLINPSSPGGTTKAAAPPLDREMSPVTLPTTDKPEVTTGVAESKAPQTSTAQTSAVQASTQQATITPAIKPSSSTQQSNVAQTAASKATAAQTSTAETSTRPTTTSQTSTPQKRQSMVSRLRSSDNNGASASSSTTSTPDSKKSKRRSFFGKIKDKLSQ